MNEMAEKKPIPFREITENLTVLAKNGRPVSSEELYNLLQFVIDDVYKLNRSLGRTTMEIGDQKELVVAICGVLDEALQTLEDNEEGLRQLTARTQEEYRELAKQAREQQERLKEARGALEDQNAVRKRLDELCGKLDAEQAMLREVAQECKALETRAAQLDDNTLAAKEAYRDSLRAELGAREKRNAILQADIDSAEQLLAEARREEAQKTDQQRELQAGVDQLTQRLTALNKKADFLRGERDRLRKDVGDAERNNRRVLEQSGQYAAIYTALNAALRDPVLRENLFTLDQSREVLSVEAVPDMGEIGTRIESIEELDRWASAIQARIEGLISIYQSQLRKIVELGTRIALTEED